MNGRPAVAIGAVVVESAEPVIFHQADDALQIGILTRLQTRKARTGTALLVKKYRHEARPWATSGMPPLRAPGPRIQNNFRSFTKILSTAA